MGKTSESITAYAFKGREPLTFGNILKYSGFASAEKNNGNNTL
jgi:hypothetical protein